MTNTTIITTEEALIVARFVDKKYYKIEFGVNVLAKELIPYFNLPDDMFLKLVIRK